MRALSSDEEQGRLQHITILYTHRSLKPKATEKIAVAITGITKRFGTHLVLDGVDFDLPYGHIYGITGANGAGKSVLLRVICGLVRPTSGQVVVLGKRVGIDVDFPPATGALIDTPGFLANHSGFENLELLAAIGGRISRADIAQALWRVGLDPDDRRPVHTYSNGMRQRLGIAQAIMEKPQVLLLDEPTDAIDPAGWRDVYQHLIELRDEGTAILIASNNLDEIEILCDAAFVLEHKHLIPAQPRTQE